MNISTSELLRAPSGYTCRWVNAPFSLARRTAPNSARRRHRTTTCEADTQMKLGSSNLAVSKIGLGTLQCVKPALQNVRDKYEDLFNTVQEDKMRVVVWQEDLWGDTQKGFKDSFSEDDLSQVFKAAVAGGINFFDTAEIYGYQSLKEGAQSEQILGRLAKDSGKPCVLGTKFFTVPWTNLLIGGGFRLGRQSIVKALKNSLNRLGLQKIQLYQVHFPFPFFGQEVLSEGFAEAFDMGLIEAVGVCNYKVPQLQQFHSLMLARNIPIASNQVKYNVFERGAEKDGVLQACKDLGITLVAHSPLQQGLLTAKALEAGRGKGDEQTILKLLQFIGAVSGGKSVTQVALGYLIAKGAIPIPGAKNLEQLRDHLGALDFNLDANEVAVIDERLDAAK